MLLENYDEKNVGANCIDLRIRELYKIGKTDVVDWEEKKLPEYKKIPLEKPYILKPGEYVLIKTMEKVNMPTNYIGLLLIRTTAFRLGLNILSTKIDAGYVGELVVGLHNVGPNKVVIKKGMSFLTLLISDLKGNTISYISKYMGGKVMI